MACEKPLDSLPLNAQTYAGYCGVVGYFFEDPILNAVRDCSGAGAGISSADPCILLAGNRNSIYDDRDNTAHIGGTGSWTVCLEAKLQAQGKDLYADDAILSAFCIEPEGGSTVARTIFGWTTPTQIGVGAAGGAIATLLVFALLFMCMRCGKCRDRRRGLKYSRKNSWMVRGAGTVLPERGWQPIETGPDATDAEAGMAKAKGFNATHGRELEPYRSASPEPYRGHTPDPAQRYSRD